MFSKIHLENIELDGKKGHTQGVFLLITHTIRWLQVIKVQPA